MDISPKTYKWLTKTGKNAQDRSLLERRKSKLQDITSHQSEWPSKSPKSVNAGEGVERGECSFTVGGNVG